MPKHEDMDYRHEPLWCDDCYREQREGKVLSEMRRTNDLTERALDMRQAGEWVEPRQQPRPTYVLPSPTTTKPKDKGGMNIEPRREDSR
jgi:hypothetical protein